MSPERSPNKRPARVSTAPSMESEITTRHSRRPLMTAYEKNAFDSMFDMIFRAATQKKENFTTAAAQLPLESRERRSAGWSWLQHSPSKSINANGSTRNDMELQVEQSSTSSGILPIPSSPLDTYGKLRNLPKRTTELDQLLDEKKEEVSLCHSDLEVLKWAIRELFGESDSQSSSTSSSNYTPLPPTLYAPLLTYLMQYFISYPHQNYHVALALFTYVKTLSPTSYVFGCNTSAYNVYLQARWAMEQDSSEILAILQEMDANGVSYDIGTRRILEKVRRDIEDNWKNSEEVFEDSSNLNGRLFNPFSSLEKAEQLMKHGRRAAKFSPNSNNDKLRAGQVHSQEFGKLEVGEEDHLSLT